MVKYYIFDLRQNSDNKIEQFQVLGDKNLHQNNFKYFTVFLNVYIFLKLNTLTIA